MDVKLPKLGEGADSGVVVSIAVKEGDRVAKGQTIIELENEKAVAAIPSSAAGVVQKVRVKAGDRVSVGHVLIELEEAGAAPAAAPSAPAAPAAKAAKAAPKAAAAPAPEPAEASAEEAFEATDGAAAKAGFAPAASPTIRKLARDLGIDLRKVRGTEAGGRICLGDLREYIARLQRQAARPEPAAVASASASVSVAPAKPVAESIDFSQWGPITQKPFPPIRQTISRRMVENKASIPHVTQFDEADISALTELRKKYAAAYEGKGARLTLTSFALKIVANALKKFPLFNSSLDEATQQIVLKNYFHIGLAVDTDQGLLVPVIRNVDQKNLLQLSKDITEMAEKARSRKVSIEEMKGGTFTISNQGGIGGAHFTPIVNKPEVAILGLGRGALKPVVTAAGQIEARLMMPMGLSYDHRVIDGGEAARFIVELGQGFQNFKEEDVKI